jgi:hypothetical protein
MRDPKNPERHLTTREMHAYRKDLYEQQCGVCHWCKGQMVFRERCPPGENVGKVATFEHLEDSFSPTGRNSLPETIVLSCSDCNNLRNKEREVRVMAALKQHFGAEHHKVRRHKTTAELIQLLLSVGINPLE